METSLQGGKTGMNWRRVGKWGAGIVVALAVFLGWVHWYYMAHAPERDPQQFSTQAEWVLWGIGMKRAYVADTYGGDTPEETLNMYIAALEAGDVDLAAKYYIPEKWGEKEQSLAKGKENGALPKLVEVYKTASLGKETEPDEYFMTVSEGDKAMFDIVFRKNSYTSKWKIVEP